MFHWLCADIVSLMLPSLACLSRPVSCVSACAASSHRTSLHSPFCVLSRVCAASVAARGGGAAANGQRFRCTYALHERTHRPSTTTCLLAVGGSAESFNPQSIEPKKYGGLGSV
eukprot:2063089-Prymnesium_polylepis.3